MGTGENHKTQFWLDCICWVMDKPLKTHIAIKDCYHRVNSEAMRKPNTISLKEEFRKFLDLVSNGLVNTEPDRWVWENGDGTKSGYLVKKFRWDLDNLKH